ncbi:MAG: hypothetical protein ACRCVG_04580 [Methanobacteriaceae archaeon]
MKSIPEINEIDIEIIKNIIPFLKSLIDNKTPNINVKDIIIENIDK